MKGLERMISRVRTMLVMGQSPEGAYEELVAQGVDTDLAHWAIQGAKAEIKYWEKKLRDNDESN